MPTVDVFHSRHGFVFYKCVNGNPTNFETERPRATEKFENGGGSDPVFAMLFSVAFYRLSLMVYNISRYVETNDVLLSVENIFEEKT